MRVWGVYEEPCRIIGDPYTFAPVPSTCGRAEVWNIGGFDEFPSDEFEKT